MKTVKKKEKDYSTRLVLGYDCRLQYDRDSECYLIWPVKFPELLEDGIDSKTATVRMRCTLAKHIRKMKAMGKEIPPMDNPDWEKVLAFTGHFPESEAEES